MSRNAKSFTRKAEVLLGGCLNTNGIKGEIQHGCNVLAHLLNVRRETRCLCYNGCIDIADLPSFFAYQFCCLGEQNATVDILKAVIAVGEVFSHVSKRQGTKERVTNGMQKHVGIGVTK